MTLAIKHKVGPAQYFPVQYMEHDEETKTGQIIFLDNSFTLLPNSVMQQDLKTVDTRKMEKHFDKPYLTGVLDFEGQETEFLLRL
ncbi:hypothetical protein A2662_03395 [Candidatus Giovannonibacteria bacterium RIFCSPHIGHO2_01_FULL_45_33]|uniref:Uncharacterized protein n=1 Tax=Candidatus Giovannonibacteria bacterium RIFCSPLOWO2_01_FULL_45_34 TaxID=1798351 RepID=A0A1F5X095_9BACT|nr:MAG: hypothetical protein A2662_03395 [Candidatus Giovannonibacteria bacterium RIFCSPHIGHO2_01_FULL_45_33]OGF70276.1 MAG: hypothetical protein A3C73_01280 [Candidatus Giovannonibacteria bacterium RIFCSPHIGHO2_02_FULL_44_11]OGF81314.1 MAG: hypothetical protein A2930_03565 [Candidatus Giovannonibacteria bacterium RIFCSPLOWO2_01_FULL_45_34]